MKHILIFLLILLTSCSHTYYIVRHAEKAEVPPGTANKDIPLSGRGLSRALALRDLLKHKNIHYVFSTDYNRTRATVQPVADYFHLPVELYGPAPDEAFISKLKAIRKNVVIAGHSNTVDDIVDMICGKKRVGGDLDESEFDNLFIVKKRGKRYIFKKEHYGPSPH
ncbi:MAG: histidine phosphatase family protein [Chitinophagaceae bacterium]|jgi:phosphohistidine phosphatase SixA|nr:histidine phosphatase family protein [Chitinophagaceae bacterium]OQY94329.1 MAG: hypothetical protein B6D37_08730 [Sphingobacteriales bacterium UTBCD1]